MSLIGLLVTLVIVGVILWWINSLEKIDGKIKKIINVVAVIAVIVWLLYAFGLMPIGGDIKVKPIR